MAGATVLVAGMLALVWAYNYGGGADPGLLDRAGPAVTWVLASAKLVFNLASAGTIGALVLAAFALPRQGAARERALRFAGWSAAAWFGGAAVHTYASFLFIANTAPSSGLSEAFLQYLTKIDAGRAGALATLIAGAVAVACFRLRSPRLLAGTTAIAFAGLLPLVMKSHASGGTDHADSTTAIFLHAATAAVWVGGLMVLVVLRKVLTPDQLDVTVRRYSTLALICFIALAVTGSLGALARITTVEALLSPYGVIVLAKLGVLVILGVFGAVHRHWSINRMEKNPRRGGRLFAVLAVAELGVMGAASGMAAALARTEPPASTVTRATREAGAKELATAPPGPGLVEYLSGWAPDPLWSLVCGFAVFAYLAGVRRLRADGRSWPPYRTVLWLAGMAVLFVVTNGGVHVYQGYLLNAHVLTQMMLTAVVPLLLVPAAPLTLVRRAVRARTDGSTGVKEFVERTVQPWLAAVRRDPVLAIFILAACLIATYYTPLLEWAAAGQAGYSAMSLLALLSGCLTTAAFTGTRSPGLIRQRLLVLAGIGLLYLFGGWKIVEQAPAMELPWYTAVGKPWGLLPAAAAELGGPVMWSVAALWLAVTGALVLIRRDARAGGPVSGGGSRRADAIPTPALVYAAQIPGAPANLRVETD
ncbi:cytochrome c oxidase assembly protein [Arthrobacter sp. 9AX]|uniref:cytochrome c oxidase assembly protein n=1 Tax=Arthrobacter sp. 9AX TaxID=2653131 RepID=UPI0013578D7A|nr:cytochrome c oxidase assembly protein [Arthrobacter sp. 9AX]